MDDFKKFKFEKVLNICDYNTDSYPLFLNSDGIVLLIKDSSDSLREPTIKEIEYCCRYKKKKESSSVKGLVSSNSTESCSTNESDIKNNCNTAKIKNKTFTNTKKDKALVIKVKKATSDMHIKEM